MNRIEREKQQAREAAERATRAWIEKQPKEERRRIAEFALTLTNTADRCYGRISAIAVGRFLRVYVDPEQKHIKTDWRKK